MYLPIDRHLRKEKMFVTSFASPIKSNSFLSICYVQVMFYVQSPRISRSRISSLVCVQNVFRKGTIARATTTLGRDNEGTHSCEIVEVGGERTTRVFIVSFGCPGRKILGSVVRTPSPVPKEGAPNGRICRRVHTRGSSRLLSYISIY